MNIKYPIPVSKARLESYLKYVRDTGYSLVKRGYLWMSDHPAYGPTTPVAESYGKKHWIYIRLAMKDEE